MRWAAVAPAVLLSLLATACAQSAQTASSPGAALSAGGPATGGPVPDHSEHATPPGTVMLKGGGRFTDADPAAIAYDRTLAPAGAQASLTAESAGGKTTSSLVVEGLLPGRAYGAHLHTKVCGGKPDDAGPHYQHHANGASAANEVWLDLTTDGEGAGRATARHAWQLQAARLPRSLVIHAQTTKSEGPDAGTAGPRVACLTLR